MGALTAVELKKLYRDPMNLIVMLLMPVGLALIFIQPHPVMPNRSRLRHKSRKPLVSSLANPSATVSSKTCNSSPSG
jgi:hypothetical protein